MTDDLRGGEPPNENASRAPAAGQPHFAPKARRVLQIFCPGAASHMDLWEHKPALAKYHGQPLPGEENFVSFQGKNGNVMQSDTKKPTFTRVRKASAGLV